MKKSKLLICGSVLVASMTLLAGCGNTNRRNNNSNSTSRKVQIARMTPKQKRINRYLSEYYKDDKSFIKSGHYDAKHNTYDVKLRNPETAKYWSKFLGYSIHVQKSHPNQEKYQSRVEQHRMLADYKAWSHASANSQTKSIDRFEEFGALVKEAEYTGQQNHDKHLALDISNLSPNSTLNMVLKEKVRDSYAKALYKNGVRGKELQKSVSDHNRQLKQQAQMKKQQRQNQVQIQQQQQRDQARLKTQNPQLWKQNQRRFAKQKQQMKLINSNKQFSPNSKQMKTLNKDLWKTAKMIRRIVKQFLNPKALNKMMKSKNFKNQKNSIGSNLSNQSSNL